MQRLWESVIQTAHTIGEIELIFYIDDDDNISLSQMERMQSSQIRAYVGKQIKIAEMWNYCYKVGTGEIFMVCADDIVFMTKNWDRLVRDEFDKWPDKIVLVYGRDGGKNERLATHPFLHKNWIETVGYFTPPYFVFQMCDKWLNEIAMTLNRRIFINDIYTEHRHTADIRFNPTGKPDDVWMDIYNRGQKEDVRGIYYNKSDERKAQIVKLQQFIENFKCQN